MTGFIAKEKYWGNIEYKSDLINMTPEKIKKYATQLKFRIIEGSGTAIYIIGVLDNGQVMGIHETEITKCTAIIQDMCNEVDVVMNSSKIIDINKKYKLLIYVLKNKFDIDDIPYLRG